MNTLISNRFVNNGKAILNLNDIQVRLRNRFVDKVRSATYQYEEIDCSVCGPSETELLAEKDRYGLKCPVVICKNCGLIFTNPRMNQGSYARFYDSEYRELYHGYVAPYEDLFNEELWSGSEIALFLSKNNIKIHGKRVLEVRCGSGGILAHFRENYDCEVAGCDFGSEGIRYGIENHELSLQEGGLESIKLPWKPDLIIYSHVFEHILDLNKECDRIKDCLAKNGSVYIEVPSVKNIRNKFKWDFLRLLQNAHTYHFTLRTLENVMSKNGFVLKSGNEFVKSLFVIDTKVNSLRNDYDDVIQFLKSTELIRPFVILFIPIVHTKALLIKILKKSGLYKVAKWLLSKQ